MVDDALFGGTVCVCHQIDRVLVLDMEAVSGIFEKKRSGCPARSVRSF
jgi:hypothetical protein